MTWERTLFRERKGRWEYWWEEYKERDAIKEGDMSTCRFIH